MQATRGRTKTAAALVNLLAGGCALSSNAHAGRGTSAGRQNAHGQEQPRTGLQRCAGDAAAAAEEKKNHAARADGASGTG